MTNIRKHAGRQSSPRPRTSFIGEASAMGYGGGTTARGQRETLAQFTADLDRDTLMGNPGLMKMAAKIITAEKARDTQRKRRQARTAILGTALALTSLVIANEVSEKSLKDNSPKKQSVAVDSIEPAVVIAQPGDTLWKYADAINDQPGNDQDIRQITDDLAVLNGSPSIDAGQSVKLPPYSHDMQPDKPGTQLRPPESK